MTPRRRLLLPLLLGVLSSGAAQPRVSVLPAQGVTLPELTAASLSAAQLAGIQGVLKRAGGVRLGLLVQDAASGQTLYARQPDAPYTPASNMKLLSLGAALYTLGPDYWFSTSVTRPRGEAGHAEHLTLVGSGDPSLEAASGEHSLAGLARQVYARGVRRVDRLRLDAHLIGAAAGTQEAGWSVPVVERPVTGLSLNDPSVGEGAELTSSPDARAALLDLGRAFRTELQRAGVQVAEGLDLASGPEAALPEDGLATTRSAPLSALVRSALKRSDNVWTEQLYARLGVNVHTPEWRPASPVYARQQEETLLLRAGAGLRGLVIRDGSGLSGQDRLTPRALVALLRYVYLYPPGQRPSGAPPDPQATFTARSNALIEALPRAGTGTATAAASQLGGTLATRLGGLDVRAKTGTLPGVSALSGYLRARSGRILIFSVLMDGYGGPGQDLRTLQDALLRSLAADR